MTLGWFFFYSVSIYTVYHVLAVWDSYGML
jgi:hypothetical protein